MIPLRDTVIIHVAHRITTERLGGSSVFTYGEPVAIRGSLGSIGAMRAIQLYGEKSGNTYRFIPIRNQSPCKVGDRVWINTGVPETYDQLASTADFVVDDAPTRSGVTQMVLKKV